MRILITSDIHRNINALTKVLKKHNDVEYHLDAGDSNLSYEFLTDKNILSVKGNTDFFINLPINRILNIDNKTILLIHGHTLKVKKNLNLILAYAKSLKVDICIYGHTHIQSIKEIGGITFLNPGALTDGKYAVYNKGEISLF